MSTTNIKVTNNTTTPAQTKTYPTPVPHSTHNQLPYYIHPKNTSNTNTPTIRHVNTPAITNIPTPQANVNTTIPETLENIVLKPSPLLEFGWSKINLNPSI
jgi:hypothetical protein